MMVMKKCLILLLTLMVVLPVTGNDYESSRRYDILFHEAMLQRQKGHHDAAFSLLLRCLELQPQAAEAHFFVAQYHDEMKRDSLALLSYQRADSLCPGNMTYMETLAQAYMERGRYAEAISVVERMYESNKSRQELLETLYRLYLQERDLDKAIGVLDRMELIDGKSERLSLAKSRLYLDMGEEDKALAEIKELAERYPNDLNYRTVYASTLLVREDRAEALEVLEGILAEEPGNVKAQFVLRNYYIREENAEAADSMTRCILLNPKATTEEKVYQLRQIIAESENQVGDSTQVLALFNEMLAMPQPDPDIAEMRAAYMDLKKMPEDSIVSAFEQVLKIAPDRASSRMRLVQMAWANEDKERVIELCREARQYNPEEMAFYYFQGIAYYQQQDTDHALETFQNGIAVINDESSPEIVSDFYAVMGDLLQQKDRTQEAFAAYDSCLVWKPDNIGCLNNYAYYLSLQGERLEEAEQMSYKTIKAEPKNATYLDTYAWILFMQERYGEARIYIDQALQNDSTAGAVVLEHAGDIYALSGDVTGAVALWQQALAQDPSNKLLARKIKRKKYIRK